MKNNEMNETPFTDDLMVNIEPFNWFWGDLSDDFEDDYESPLESMNTVKMDTDEIDELAKAEDYFWYQAYLDKLDEDDKVQAQEYVKNNFPEFWQDDENLDDDNSSMKSNKVKNKEIFDELDKKSHFNKSTIKDELWDALIDSYKNAA